MQPNGLIRDPRLRSAHAKMEECKGRKKRNFPLNAAYRAAFSNFQNPWRRICIRINLQHAAQSHSTGLVQCRQGGFHLAADLLNEMLYRTRHIHDQSVHIQPQHPVVVWQPLADKVRLVEVHVRGALLSRFPIDIETHPIHVIPAIVRRIVSQSWLIISQQRVGGLPITLQEKGIITSKNTTHKLRPQESRYELRRGSQAKVDVVVGFESRKIKRACTAFIPSTNMPCYHSRHMVKRPTNKGTQYPSRCGAEISIDAADYKRLTDMRNPVARGAWASEQGSGKLLTCPSPGKAGVSHAQSL